MTKSEPYDAGEWKARGSLKDATQDRVLASTRGCVWNQVWFDIVLRMDQRIRDEVWDAAWSVYDEIRGS